MKYAYPAIFTKEKEGGFSVSFPDIEGCLTCAEDLPQAIERAQDALCLMLYDKEECGELIPPVSDIKNITVSGDDFVSLIVCDTLEYKRFYENKAVKKTLTIPSWLNAKAEHEGVNFSQVLQEALKTHLGI